MTERELADLLRRSARRHPAGELPAGFTASVLARLAPAETLSSVLPILTTASVLALLLSLFIATSHQATPPAGAPPRLALFGANPGRAPFVAP